MPTIDQQFVEYISKTLVNNPDKVTVDRITDERGVLLTLTVDPSDIGRVIGKGGSTAQSIRTLLRALGTKNQAHYNLKIVDTDADSAEASETPAVSAEDNASTEEESADFSEKTRAEIAEIDDIDL